MVDLPIGLVALHILVSVLDRGDAEHDEQGEDDKTGGDGREDREELENGDSQEEAAWWSISAHDAKV